MPGPRTHFAMGLVLLLLCALSDCSGSAPSGASPTGYAQQQQQRQQREERDEYRRLVEAVRRVKETRARSGSRRESRLSSRSRIAALEARDFRSSRTDREQAVFPQNLKKKEQFLQHITGPLYFSQKCRKHAYRLYHQTRDCTKPAYFKRCARLLTRLAGSQQCLEG